MKFAFTAKLCKYNHYNYVHAFINQKRDMGDLPRIEQRKRDSKVQMGDMKTFKIK